MGFDIPKLKQKFLIKYPSLINVYDWWTKLKNIKYKQNHYKTDKTVLKQKLGSKEYKNVVSMFSKCMDFHNHIFRATEAYGRIFMPFQNLPKEFRDCIVYKLNNTRYYIKELFDMKCCFVQLSANLAIKQLDPNNPNYTQLKSEYTRVLETAKSDIYTDILNTINKPNLTRNDIKAKIMLWLFSTHNQRKNIQDPVIQAITEYFQFKFPNFYQFIISYKLTKSTHKLKYKQNKNKVISSLSTDCFNYESELVLEELIPNYKQTLNNTLADIYIALHDGIYILSNILNNIYKYTLNIINNNKYYYNNIKHYLCGVNSLYRMNPG